MVINPKKIEYDSHDYGHVPVYSAELHHKYVHVPLSQDPVHPLYPLVTCSSINGMALETGVA